MQFQATKRCVKCGETKPRKEFYLRDKLRNLLRSECKLCSRLKQQERSEYQRLYANRRYAEDEEFREKKKAGNKRRAQDRTKVKARYRVYDAVKSGKLIRQPCIVCGKPNGQAHHEDYSKPLEVIWLCPSHHQLHHKAKDLKIL